MSESTGWQVKMICSETFVFCSSLLVSLAFGVSCQRSRLSEIRWLNVKQPASTQSGSIQHSRSGPDSIAIRLSLERDQARSRTGSGSIQLSSRGELTRTITCTRCVVSCGSSQRCLVSVTYRSDPRDLRSPRAARLLSDRNCELSANTPRGLETCSGVIGHSYLH